ncbi:MAG: NAD(P)H-hydrate dehydratase [Ginsengibacter sp.]
MKIFSAVQIRKWDEFTIANEPIASIDLMERAASRCTEWLLKKFDADKSFKIFCGKGNNGGDGLAIARLLSQSKRQVSVYVTGSKPAGSFDFEQNLLRLKELSIDVTFLESKKTFASIEKNDIVIDALFGTGLNKKPLGIYLDVINCINDSCASIVSIDVPSGLFTDKSSAGNDIVKARYTLTFQQVKLAFLFAENESFTGEINVLDIGLSPAFYNNENSNFFLVDKEIIRNIYIPRKAFANKGNYGYACLVAGSYGMMGASILSAWACLRSGVGKLTSYICEDGYTIMQSCVPEGMCKVFGKTFIKDVNGLSEFDVVGVGPGIGKHPSHKELLQAVFKNSNQLIIDADGLNALSANKSLYKSIPANTIITPHPKEFEKLFGKTANNFEMIELARGKAKQLQIYIVLKGHHTFITTPDGEGYFNSTGNSGMATAGAGDVLTGIITALLAQHYSPLHACILGIYLHGLAGDIAADKLSKEAMIAGDIIDFLGDGFLAIENFSREV